MLHARQTFVQAGWWRWAQPKAAKATFVALHSAESRQSYSRRSRCWQNGIDNARYCCHVIHAAGASQKTQSKKVESKNPFFDCVRKPYLGFSRKRPFSTDKSDCIRNGLTTLALKIVSSDQHQHLMPGTNQALLRTSLVLIMMILQSKEHTLDNRFQVIRQSIGSQETYCCPR